MDEAHGVIERIYRNVLSGAPLDAWFSRRSHGNPVSPVRRRPCPNPCLVPKSGAVPTAYRPADSVSLVQTRNPSNHRGSRVECDSSFATPCTKQKISRGSESSGCASSRFSLHGMQSGSKTPANSGHPFSVAALTRRSISMNAVARSPRRSEACFFIRDLSAVNEVEPQISGI